MGREQLEDVCNQIRDIMRYVIEQILKLNAIEAMTGKLVLGVH